MCSVGHIKQYSSFVYPLYYLGDQSNAHVLETFEMHNRQYSAFLK